MCHVIHYFIHLNKLELQHFKIFSIVLNYNHQYQLVQRRYQMHCIELSSVDSIGDYYFRKLFVIFNFCYFFYHVEPSIIFIRIWCTIFIFCDNHNDPSHSHKRHFHFLNTISHYTSFKTYFFSRNFAFTFRDNIWSIYVVFLVLIT